MADNNTIYKLLSAEIKALTSRISKQDEIIAVLQSEIIRLSGSSSSTGHSSSGDYRVRKTHHTAVAGAGTNSHFKNSIPLAPSASSAPMSSSKPLVRRSRPVVVDDKHTTDSVATHVTLSSILKKDEVVTVEVGLTRDESGVFDSFATCVAKFDGSDLNVTDCSLASELVGTKTNKPGEVLYKFMDALLKGKHIKSKFACPPWKLCSVMRDGTKTTLDELRSKLASH